MVDFFVCPFFLFPIVRSTAAWFNALHCFEWPVPHCLMAENFSLNRGFHFDSDLLQPSIEWNRLKHRTLYHFSTRQTILSGRIIIDYRKIGISEIFNAFFFLSLFAIPLTHAHLHTHGRTNGRQMRETNEKKTTNKRIDEQI